jgi:hypothetical protein
VVPGLQLPLHTPPPHAEFMHGDGAPHVPFDAHDCTPLPLHCAWPGAHVPVHAPPTHVWFVHAAGGPHVPLALQVWTPFPEHCVEPGPHATHVLLRQLGVDPEHVD